MGVMSSNEEVRVVSIDFGTAFSKAAVAPRVAGQTQPSRIQVLRVGAQGESPNPYLVPSALCLLDRSIHFGARAVAAADRLPERREALQSFKLLLGASDLSALLDTSPPRKIDPDARFSYRDLIVLFLAYFIDVTELAMGGVDLADPASSCVMRYTRPGWFSSRTGNDHAEIVALLRTGKGVLEQLGSGFWREPLPYDAAATAIKAARAHPGLIVEAGVFEATASASCHLQLTDERLGIMILDIGAGTTDIEAFVLSDVGAAPERIGDSRLTLSIAGDNIDRVLLNILVDSAKGARSITERADVWRALLPRIRALKAQLFEKGKVSLTLRSGVTVSCTLSKLSNSKDYKRIVKAISAAFRELVDAAAIEAKKHGLRELLSVATGGGATLPFVQDLIRKTKPKVRQVAMRRIDSVPQWVRGIAAADEVAPIFNQLAVVIGGAIAPRNLLIVPAPIVRNAYSPVSGKRSAALRNAESTG